MPKTVALATCEELPGLDGDSAMLLPHLRQEGLKGIVAVWDDPEVNWEAFDLVLLRSTWDYTRKFNAFLNWVRDAPNMLNSPQVVAWNSDKHYLAELRDKGVATVPTVWLEPKDLQAFSLPSGDIVIKPSVSAGARDTGRYSSNSGMGAAQARKHITGLLEAGRAVMIQPYIASVDAEGERAHIFIDGVWSHVARKSALLPAPGMSSHNEKVEACEPQEEEVDFAARALRAAAEILGEMPFYARVDVVTGPGRNPMLLELELIEPCLFLIHGGGGRLARAGAERL